jgi:nucleoside phosphorylase
MLIFQPSLSRTTFLSNFGVVVQAPHIKRTTGINLNIIQHFEALFPTLSHPSSLTRLDDISSIMATYAIPSSPDIYTVGWICALPLELAAAAAMLDENHQKPLDFAPATFDKNTYILGSIREHNVVIASLPAGAYGTSAVVTTASSMLSSFPQIRVGLLVGIGAAIASPEQGRDIRLGDVVVGYPDGRSGGVVQYDFGKAKEGHVCKRIGALNMPPKAFLIALARLQVEHEMNLPKFPEFLNEMVKKNPRMTKLKSGYVYQGKENDRLFHAAYTHSDGLGCSNCDSTGLIAREDRDSDKPEVHYGIIASGNAPVNDAATRDLIAENTGDDCICIETEAAGLMNNFPCLLIRGICDYADSHKNDRWQRYAAATAAAYTKEFLSIIPGEDLKKTQKATEILEDLEKTQNATEILEDS